MKNDTHDEQTWIDELPSALADRLAELPSYAYTRLLEPPVEGRSQLDLFWASCELTREGFTKDEQETVLRAWFCGYHRPIEDREFRRAIESAFHKTTNEGDLGEQSSPRWPEPDPDLIGRITACPFGAQEDLRSLSPIPDAHRWDTTTVIDRLFAPTDLLCFGTARMGASTSRRESFRGRESYFPFVVPNTMAALTGIKTDGGTSMRCLANVGPVIHQVIEFDKATRDEQARALLHLRTMVPLRMVVYSGGKSLHGWFDVRAVVPAVLEDFRCYAAALGADPAMFVPCQFARNPNGWRGNGKGKPVQQSVLFLS